MKTNLSFVKKSIVMMAIGLIGISSVNAAPSADFFKNDPTITSLGIVSGEMIFNLKYENAEGDNIEIVLQDKEGNRLFRQVFSDKMISKTFRVPQEVEAVVVKVTNVKTKDEQKFEIAAHQRTVDEVVVTSVR